jgi:hypothetical protein
LSFISAARMIPERSIPVGVLGLLEHLVDDRLVERRLLLGEVAVDAHLDLLGQVGDDAPVGLQPAQDERAGRLAQTLGRVAVAVALDRRRVAALERRRRAEQPRIEEVHDRVELGQPVLDRRAGQRDPMAGASERIARVCFASIVLMFCASSSTTRSHLAPASVSRSRTASA